MHVLALNVPEPDLDFVGVNKSILEESRGQFAPFYKN